MDGQIGVFKHPLPESVRSKSYLLAVGEESMPKDFSNTDPVAGLRSSCPDDWVITSRGEPEAASGGASAEQAEVFGSGGNGGQARGISEMIESFSSRGTLKRHAGARGRMFSQPKPKPQPELTTFPTNHVYLSLASVTFMNNLRGIGLFALLAAFFSYGSLLPIVEENELIEFSVKNEMADHIRKVLFGIEVVYAVACLVNLCFSTKGSAAAKTAFEHARAVEYIEAKKSLAELHEQRQPILVDLNQKQARFRRLKAELEVLKKADHDAGRTSDSDQTKTTSNKVEKLITDISSTNSLKRYYSLAINRCEAVMDKKYDSRFYDNKLVFLTRLPFVASYYGLMCAAGLLSLVFSAISLGLLGAINDRVSEKGLFYSQGCMDDSVNFTSCETPIVLDDPQCNPETNRCVDAIDKTVDILQSYVFMAPLSFFCSSVSLKIQRALENEGYNLGKVTQVGGTDANPIWQRQLNF